MITPDPIMAEAQLMVTKIITTTTTTLFSVSSIYCLLLPVCSLPAPHLQILHIITLTPLCHLPALLAQIFCAARTLPAQLFWSTSSPLSFGLQAPMTAISVLPDHMKMKAASWKLRETGLRAALTPTIFCRKLSLMSSIAACPASQDFKRAEMDKIDRATGVEAVLSNQSTILTRKITKETLKRIFSVR